MLLELHQVIWNYLSKPYFFLSYNLYMVSKSKIINYNPIICNYNLLSLAKHIDNRRLGQLNTINSISYFKYKHDLDIFKENLVSKHFVLYIPLEFVISRNRIQNRHIHSQTLFHCTKMATIANSKYPVCSSCFMFNF